MDLRHIIIFFSVFLPGCVSIKTHEDGIAEAYKLGLQRAAAFIDRYDCKEIKWLVGSEISGAERQAIGR